MPRSGNPFFPVVNLMLVPIGLGMLVIGPVGLFSDSEIWFVFAGLTAAGALMVGGAVHNIVKWWRWQRREEGEAAAMAAAARAHTALLDPSVPASLPSIPVLAHWTYEPDEWSAYAQREVRDRNAEGCGLVIGVVLLGTVVVWQEARSWPLSFAIALGLGAVIGGAKWLMAKSAHERNTATPRGEVVISPTAILMNGSYQVIQDHHFRFRSAQVQENVQPKLLVIGIEWPTRSGVVTEDYRIPIPAGREAEAHYVARELEKLRLAR